MAGYIENSRRAPIGYPAKLAGVPDALIFFCFFSSIKRRKEDHEARESCIKARKEEGSKQKSHAKQIKGRRFTPYIRGQGVGLSCLAPNPSAKAPRRPQTALHRFAQLPNHPSTAPNHPAQALSGPFSGVRNFPNEYNTLFKRFGTSRINIEVGYEPSELPDSI